MSLTSSTSMKETEVYYPSSDGQPMAETPIHVQAIILLYQALEDFLAALTDIYLAADMLWYWEEGNTAACRAPDIMVIKGVGRAERRSFFSWRENGAVPCFIVEFASENTWREDLYEKRRLYAALGVREYVIFDPEALYLRPPLQGFRLNTQGVYLPLEVDGLGRLHSEELSVHLRCEGTMLRLIDATSGRLIPTRQEQVEQERHRVEQERQRAEQEHQRAEQEHQRAEQLEAEVARLRALVEERSQEKPDDPQA